MKSTLLIDCLQVKDGETRAQTIALLVLEYQNLRIKITFVEKDYNLSFVIPKIIYGNIKYTVSIKSHWPPETKWID